MAGNARARSLRGAHCMANGSRMTHVDSASRVGDEDLGVPAVAEGMPDTPADDDVERALSSLADGWTVWSHGEDGRLVLAYRPDVFNADDFPAACLPTLYLTHGKRTRRPGTNPTSRTDETDWYVTLYLEPDVSAENERFPTQSDAIARALELASAFDDGEIDYRELYQVPRETYFDRLDELTGSDDCDERSEHQTT